SILCFLLSFVFSYYFFFFFTNTPPTEIYPLSLHDALPISVMAYGLSFVYGAARSTSLAAAAKAVPDADGLLILGLLAVFGGFGLDRKSTRLNSSHLVISYAVFCLKKKKKKYNLRVKTEKII